MSSARKKATHQDFEGIKPSGNFVKICYDMMDSAAWKKLTRSQRCLYLELKRKYTAKRSKGQLISDNSKDISMPASEISEKRLYTNLKVFRADIDRLIDCGFIDCLESGYAHRVASIYGFSDRWKKFGQEGYEVPHEAKRPEESPKRKQRKKSDRIS